MGSTHRTLRRGTVRGECRWCAGPIARPRRTFCSDACVHEFQIRSDPGYAREQVRARDRGVCAACKLDTVRLERLLVSQGRLLFGRDRRSRVLRLLGLEHTDQSHLWEMDHVLPVVEGGGECGLDNLRTLCLWCHKRETRRLARRRARARTTQAALFEAPILDADIDAPRDAPTPRPKPSRHGPAAHHGRAATPEVLRLFPKDHDR